ncbi:flagellar protein FlaG [Thermoguttaceae bacterium LCP21S3_D4]|nr:flagellar protein FlaG [Lachnospiraceae bacterium]MDD6303357.1 flagellar protein FlaG [Lachnospiraceae bacterium]
MSIESIRNSGSVYQGSSPVQGTTKESSSVTTEGLQTSADEMQQENANALENAAVTQSQNPTEEEKATASSSEQVKKAVESINRSQAHTEAIFGIHEGTNRVTIKIVDKESKKVIKEYPPEKTLDMIQKLWEMAGLMVDEKR